MFPSFKGCDSGKLLLLFCFLIDNPFLHSCTSSFIYLIIKVVLSSYIISDTVDKEIKVAWYLISPILKSRKKRIIVGLISTGSWDKGNS